MNPGLAAANSRRRDNAARRRVAEARAAIWALERRQPEFRHYRYREFHELSLAVLHARVQYPRHSLAQIAAEIGVTKDTYSARLRRALDYAGRMRCAS